MAEPYNHTTKYLSDSELNEDGLSCEDLEEKGFKPTTAYVDSESGEIYALVNDSISGGLLWVVVGQR